MPHDKSACIPYDLETYVVAHGELIQSSKTYYLDGVTMLPTFMPVATQAAIKGLTPQQMEGLGVTLILNNTYHLNLRPGLQVLKEAGGAHKFQNWDRNLLTVNTV